MLADLIVEVMVSMAAKLLDANADERDELAARTERQLRLIAVGDQGWRPGRRRRSTVVPAGTSSS